VRYNPEILVIAPCGFETKRAKQEMFLLTQKPGWNELKAVQAKQVYLADYDLFTQPSASTLTDGIELLAALFHPGLFKIPTRLENKYLSVYEPAGYVHA
jgi:iron complex transport system substrate-binding protein